MDSSSNDSDSSEEKILAAEILVHIKKWETPSPKKTSGQKRKKSPPKKKRSPIKHNGMLIWNLKKTKPFFLRKSRRSVKNRRLRSAVLEEEWYIEPIELFSSLETTETEKEKNLIIAKKVLGDDDLGDVLYLPNDFDDEFWNGGSFFLRDFSGLCESEVMVENEGLFWKLSGWLKFVDKLKLKSGVTVKFSILNGEVFIHTSGSE